MAIDVAVLELSGFRAGGHCSRQRQQRSPDTLGNQRKDGNVTRVKRGDALEKKTVTRHRVVDARARQNQSIVASEGGDHDRNGHQDHAGLAQRRFHRFSSHSIRRFLQSGKGAERQRHHVSNIGEQIESDHRATTNQQRARQVASGVADLAAGESDVVPG